MRRVALAVAAVLLAGSAFMARESPAQESKQVRAEGCVEAGVEASCLVLKDAKSGKLYNLLIKGTKPEVGDGIEFTGAPFNGASYCMQGTVVQVTKWTRKDSLKCSKGATPKE